MLGITGPGAGEGLSVLTGGVATAAGLVGTPGTLLFIAATLAAISARFWAMSASPDSCDGTVSRWGECHCGRRLTTGVDEPLEGVCGRAERL